MRERHAGRERLCVGPGLRGIDEVRVPVQRRANRRDVASFEIEVKTDPLPTIAAHGLGRHVGDRRGEPPSRALKTLLHRGRAHLQEGGDLIHGDPAEVVERNDETFGIREALDRGPERAVRPGRGERRLEIGGSRLGRDLGRAPAPVRAASPAVAVLVHDAPKPGGKRRGLP